MNYLRVNSIDEYESELMGYNIIGNKIVYLTENDLCVVRVGNKFKKETAKIKGSSILNFVISRRGYLAFLYKDRTLEIRRMDALNEVVHRFSGIVVFADGSYPKMKWDYDELYLIYPQNLQILDIKTKARKGYTDIVVDYENQKMMDMIIANIMNAERAVILQLPSRLIFTIIPIPVTELEIPFINSVLNLFSPSHMNDPRRQFIAVLNNGNSLKIINLLNLKQICEVHLQPKANEFLQMQTDANHECILIRYVSSTTLEITKNVIFKINSGYYYCENYNYYGERQPFFTYKFEISVNENLTLFPMTVEEVNGQIFDYYHLVFFKKGHLYSVIQFIPNSYSQTPTELKIKKRKDWKEAEEWKELISTFLELGQTQVIPQEKRSLTLAEQDRQMKQYNIIKTEFDSIIAKFTAKINEEGKVRSLNEKNIQDQWEEYIAKIAKERNFMLQTMKLFKIEPQIIRNNHSQKQSEVSQKQIADQEREREIKQKAVSKELQLCIRQIEGRQERIDAKIKQRKKEIEVQKKGKPAATKEEIQKYQEDYEKFVAEFMQENERKEKIEQENKQVMQQSIPTESSLEERLILALPSLNEQEMRIINNFTSENLNLSANTQSISLQQDEHSHLQSQTTLHPHRHLWSQMELIFKNIEEKLNPIVQRFNPLIDRLSGIEDEGLNKIKINEEAIKAKCNLNLEEMVKNSCKHMISSLTAKIKKQIDATTREIYLLEDKNKNYYEDSIEKFKEYIRYQIQNRIDIYYKSRRRLQSRIAQMTNQLSLQPEELREKP